MNSKLKRALGALIIVGVGPCAAPLHAQDAVAQAGAAAEPEASEVEATAAADTRRIDVLEYRIDGNTVLAAADIERAVEPFLGPQRSIDEIQQARTALEAAYRKKGYETVGVEIPEQDVRTGIVRFNVVELSVGRLRVTGSRFFSPDLIKDRVPSLSEGVVPRYDRVSADIQAINNSRDRTITPTLRAGAAPGTVDVDLEVDDRPPLHGSLEVNDRYTTQTSRLRAVASVSYANLFQREHSLSLQMQATPEDLDESFLLSASYLAPIPGTTASLVVYGVHSDSDIAAVGGIDVIGKGDVFGLRAVQPLPGNSQSFSHSIIAGFDYKSFKENLILGADTAATPIDYVPLTFEYSLSSLAGHGMTEVRTSFNWGTRGLASTNEEFAQKRFGARANFVYLRTDITRTQNLPKDFRAIVGLSGQVSDQPLISNEGFSIGGVDSVRGYAESQALGDSGVRASLQLETPSLAPKASTWFNELRVFGFYDWGQVRIQDPLADVDGVVTERITLASTGLGFQARLFQKLNAMFLLAEPLHAKDDVDFDVSDRYRAQFRMWAEF